MTLETPETILIFAANPVDQPRLSLDREVREIQNGLRHSRKHFEIKQQWATRPKDLWRALLDYKPTYVHFCGHGAGRNGIVLEGQLVDAEALGGLFSLFSQNIKCVVLNACYSAIQAKAIAAHIDVVVGMSKEIGDSAAIEFATAFYDAIGAGESADFAFALGCKAIQLANIPEHLTPKLITRSESKSSEQFTPPVSHQESSRCDWDGAPSASLLYGRDAVAETLKSWILDESCRVVLITGLRGMGKTDLVTCLGRGGNRSSNTSATLSAGIQGHFDCVMWRSLLNAPPPADLFADILDFLSEHRRTTKRPSGGEQIEAILACLQNRRCLVILDNVEAILKPSDPSMQYRDGYEPYGVLFEQVAKTNHQSCLLLTSREKPRAIADLEGIRKPVRSLALEGIGTNESQNLFAQIGTFYGNDGQWKHIAELYNGNPLALELAARHIDQVFNGDLGAFLASGRPLFADLEELLDWHLDRLTKQETELICWLAVERNPVNIVTLYDDLISFVSRKKLNSTIQSLQRRIPLERFAGHHFSLQPVLIEHVTARLVDQIASALLQINSEVMQHEVAPLRRSNSATAAAQLLNSHSLVKAMATENVRDSQRRLIVGAIAERLTSGAKAEIRALCTSLLTAFQRDWAGESGYGAGNIISLLSYLKIDPHGLNFSHLPIWQACLHDINLHDTDFSFADFRHTTFRHAFGSVFALSFSSDGELVAIGDDNGDILLFFSINGEFHMRCRGHSDVISAIAFSRDGQLIASSSFDNTIRLWSTKDGRCTNTFIGHEGWVYSINFSPDGKTLASASEDGTCRLWNLQTGQWVIPATNDSGFLAAVAFSPDGLLLAVGGSSSVVNLFRLSDLIHPLLLRGHTGRVRSLAFSPQGDMLASGAEDHRINLWKPADGTLLATLSGHSGDVMSLSFSAAGDVLASASQDHSVRLWSTVRMECVANLDAASARVWSVSCNPLGRTLATGSEDGTVRVWDMDTHNCLTTLRGYSNKTWSLSFSPHPPQLIAANEDSLVRIWDIFDAQVNRELRGHSSRVWGVACSPNGRWVASASDDLTVRLWDLNSGICVYIMRGHVDWIRAVAFDPTSRLLASAAEDGNIFIWDVETGSRLRGISRELPRIFSVVFCNEGKWLAVGGAAQQIDLFSVRDGTHIGKLAGHKAWLTSVFPVPPHALASCSEDGTVKIWDLANLECSNTFVTTSDVWCGGYSGRWKSVLSGNENGILQSWMIADARCGAEIKAHQGSIRSLSVNASEEIVATTGDDGAIRLWSLPQLSPYHSPNIFRPARPYEGMNISGATGLTSAQREALMVLGAVAMPSK